MALLGQGCGSRRVASATDSTDDGVAGVLRDGSASLAALTLVELVIMHRGPTTQAAPYEVERPAE